MYQRRSVAVRMYSTAAIAAATVAAGTSIAVTSLADRVVVVVIVIQRLMVLMQLGRLLLLRMTAGRWQWGFDCGINLLMVMMLLRLSMVLLMGMLLLLLLRGHRQQPLPIVTNDLTLVLRILVGRSSHIAVAQSRWRWRMGCTEATVTFILDLGEEEIFLVTVLVRLAGAQVCVSYVSGDLRTRRVGDATTLPGAFVNQLTRPSFPWHILVVIHADSLVRVGKGCGSGAANHDLVSIAAGSGGGAVAGGAVGAVIACWAGAIAVAAATIAAGAGVLLASIVRRRGMSVLAEWRRSRAGAPGCGAAAGAGAQDGFPARDG